MKKLIVFAIAVIHAMHGLYAQLPATESPLPVFTPFLPIEMELDSIMFIDTRFHPTEYLYGEPGELTDDDYQEVADMMGVEVAAIKAVVDIETGRKNIGFYDTGKPIINFDLTMYEPAARRQGVDLKAARRDAPVIFRSPDVRRYGSRQLAQQARLDAAIEIDETSALEGTFWGMFQIGGFNWKLCGFESVQDFVTAMRRSERSQLEIFAAFCKARGLDKYIRDKNWSAFALRYNGPGYAAKGYHTKMASAYSKYKAKGY